MSWLALPGRKPQTLPWMQALLADLGEPQTPIQRYGFWSAPDSPDPDVAPEVAVAAASDAAVVIAKSIGSLIAMLARPDRRRPAQAYVFIGAPVRRLAQLGRPRMLGEQAMAAPTLFIQQTSDPTGAYGELAAALPSTASMRQVAGDDHRYDDTGELAAIISAWLRRSQ